MANSAKSKTLADIPGLPFDSFAALQDAVAGRRFSLGVDSLAAARWSDAHNARSKKIVIAAFSILLIAAAAAAVVAAFWTGNYWLLVAVPVQAGVFYVSHPSFPFGKWVTVGAVASMLIFANLLLNRYVTAAVLLAYAVLTFAVVRAASFIANSSFRKRLISDESAFIEAYNSRACTLRENKSGRVYARGERPFDGD